MRSKKEIEIRIDVLERHIQKRKKDIKDNTWFAKIIGPEAIKEYILGIRQEICILKWVLNREEENYEDI